MSKEMKESTRRSKLMIVTNDDDGMINFLISKHLEFQYERFVHKQGIFKKPRRGMYISYWSDQPVRRLIEQYQGHSVVAFETVA